MASYADDVQAKIIATYVAVGLTCSVARHLGVRDNVSVGTVFDERIHNLMVDCAEAKPDAATILYTNMNGARATASIETTTRPVVFDSRAVTLWVFLMIVRIRPEVIKV